MGAKKAIVKLVERLFKMFRGLVSKDKLEQAVRDCHITPDLSTVDITDITEEDLVRLGRYVQTPIIKKDGERISFDDSGKVKTSSRIMVPIKNKKNGRVVMDCGTVEQLKNKYGDDYEIVESAIKDPYYSELNCDMDKHEDNKTIDQ